ncbi:phosphate ABC transporter substrate-binding/OmpA family protein [Sulfitobacter sp. F26204]|uniref:phosphate ABC transporter substrate-binding/OmpA family protein n=1 Tax=Sulfitobacter sp. F26204 TaxID=2996014 RepID=UPI00225DFE0D|nr:phosphate ABC transporter substrate-binding/OmpA family protein [Sulfitobacter sp. F26204]MCX7560690.1 phosphate ABC transporter substrate-binding/OmpA family protein [Sulfitobacter sp. F26204]
MNLLKQNMVLAFLLTLMPSAVLADQVTISSPDGVTSIAGELMSFDDETYVLSTSIGELRLSRAWTVCTGQACPDVAKELELAISTNEIDASGLLRDLIDGFVGTRNLSGTSTSDGGDTGVHIDLKDKSTEDNAGSVDVSIQPFDAGFTQLSDGTIDMYLSTSRVPDAIAEQKVAAGQVDLRDGERERVIALDALVPVVHPDNPIRSVSLDALAQIAAGRIKNWSELGGPDAAIRMVLPAAGSHLDQAFSELVLEPNRVRLRSNVERSESETQAAADVAADLAAITVTSLSGRGSAEVLPIRQSCGPLAYASDFAIKAEEYPLSLRVYAYTAEDSQTPFKADFLDYMSSPDGQSLIEATGYVGQKIVTQPVSLQGTRMASALLSADTTETLALLKNFARDLGAADRLSTTFRFSSASSDLDTKSQADVERMVSYLNNADVRNRDILVIGFSDDVGRFDLNERLAMLRATSVRDALVAAPGGTELAERITISAYGPLAPVGCNDSSKGRESNRRVEIWIR